MNGMVRKPAVRLRRRKCFSSYILEQQQVSDLILSRLRILHHIWFLRKTSNSTKLKWKLVSVSSFYTIYNLRLFWFWFQTSNWLLGYEKTMPVKCEEFCLEYFMRRHLCPNILLGFLSSVTSNGGIFLIFLISKKSMQFVNYWHSNEILHL